MAKRRFVNGGWIWKMKMCRIPLTRGLCFSERQQDKVWRNEYCERES